MQSTVYTLVSENKERKSDIVTVIKDNNALKECVSVLEHKYRDLEQYFRRDNIEIVRVPLSPIENLDMLLINISQLLRMECKREYMSTTYRLAVMKDVRILLLSAGLRYRTTR